MDAQNLETGESSQAHHKLASPNRDVHFVNRDRGTWCLRYLVAKRERKVTQRKLRGLQVTTKLSHPGPKDVNRDSGTDLSAVASAKAESANPGWLQRLETHQSPC